MSFKVGDFVTDTKLTWYISDSERGGKWSVITVNKMFGGIRHYNIDFNSILFKLDPLFGLKSTDELEYIGSKITDPKLSACGNYVELNNTTTFLHFDKKSVMDLTNLTNPHWNTCAQHYKTHVLNQSSSLTPIPPGGLVPSNKFNLGDEIVSVLNSGYIGIIEDILSGIGQYKIRWKSGATYLWDIKAIDANYTLYKPSGISSGAWLSYLPVRKGYQQLNKDFTMFKREFVEDTGSCSHSWKSYNSGWSEYDYCSKCDEKKGSQ